MMSNVIQSWPFESKTWNVLGSRKRERMFFPPLCVCECFAGDESRAVNWIFPFLQHKEWKRMVLCLSAMFLFIFTFLVSASWSDPKSRLSRLETSIVSFLRLFFAFQSIAATADASFFFFTFIHSRGNHVQTSQTKTSFDGNFNRLPSLSLSASHLLSLSPSHASRDRPRIFLVPFHFSFHFLFFYLSSQLEIHFQPHNKLNPSVLSCE